MRSARGGLFEYDSTFLLASVGGAGAPINYASFFGVAGFRVATIPNLPGDFNHDGTVDAADYVVWRKNPGGIYTQNDFNIWRANFGTTLGSGAGASVNTTVPEPATWVMLIVAAFGIRLRRRQIA